MNLLLLAKVITFLCKLSFLQDVESDSAEGQSDRASRAGGRVRQTLQGWHLKVPNIAKVSPKVNC